MQILVLHNNYPAQFKNLLPKLAKLGHNVTFLSLENHGVNIPGIKHAVVKSKSSIELPSKKEPYYLLAKKINISHLFYGAFLQLKERSFDPDLVIFHSGWGIGANIRAVFPNARLAAFAEWWFSWESAELNYDSSNKHIPKQTTNSRLAERYLNFGQSFELHEADFLWTATHWQKSQFPQSLQSRLNVIHEGVDNSFFSPHHSQTDSSNQILNITYTTRGFEPIRGFDHFFHIIAILMQRHDNINLTIVGKDKPSYRALTPDSVSLGKQARLHFRNCGICDRVSWHERLNYKAYKDLLAKSDIHFYFSRPFIASWSLLEAMSSGCCVVSNDVQMIREIGLDSLFYVDCTDHLSSVSAIEEIISNAPLRNEFKLKARSRSRFYSHSQQLSRLLDLLLPHQVKAS